MAPETAGEDPGHLRGQGDRAQGRSLRRPASGERAREEAVGGRLLARRARLHEVLGVEVRACRVGAAGGMDEGGRAVPEERDERLERRMQSEESVEVDRRLAAGARARNGDRRPRRVIRLLAVRNEDVQPVHGAALEDRDEDAPRRRRARLGHPDEDARDESARDEREAGRLEEQPSIEHAYCLWKSGPPRSSAALACAPSTFGSGTVPATLPSVRATAKFTRASSAPALTQASAVSAYPVGG